MLLVPESRAREHIHIHLHFHFRLGRSTAKNLKGS